MIVYITAGASTESIDRVRSVLTAFPQLVTAAGIRYLDAEESLAEAERVLTDDPVALSRITLETVPTAFYVDPVDAYRPTDLAGLADLVRMQPEVLRVDLDPDVTPVIPLGTPAPTTTEAPAVLTDGPPLFGDPEIGASSPNWLAAGEEIRNAKAANPGLSQMDPVFVGPIDVTETGTIRIPVQLPTGTDFTDVSFLAPGDLDAHIEMSPHLEAVGPDDGLVEVVIEVSAVKYPYLDFSLWVQ